MKHYLLSIREHPKHYMELTFWSLHEAIDKLMAERVSVFSLPLHFKWTLSLH